MNSIDVERENTLEAILQASEAALIEAVQACQVDYEALLRELDVQLGAVLRSTSEGDDVNENVLRET